MQTPAEPADVTVVTLPNGVRVVPMRLVHLQTVGVSVYLHSGSAHESRPLSGISHMAEHMVFKGTHERDARRINLDAERLGADVNAHTDKDHTAFHMRGHGRDVDRLLHMLADIVQNASFPEAELERERQVLLQEYAEEADDPMSIACRLFDAACFGVHPVAQPVIGTRRNIERFTRADLLAHVQQRYTGANLVVGVAGPIDPEAVVREAGLAFGSMRRGEPHRVEPPAYVGGVRSRAMDGSSQTHAVLGFPIASLGHDDATGTLAAALFGEGMSSPLMHELREKRGLAYYAACAADLFTTHGQFVIEASMAPERLEESLREIMRLLAEHAESVSAVELERARNQLVVRWLHAAEQTSQRLERAALDLFALGRVRAHAESMQRLETVGAEEVRAVFERMLAAGVSAAISGRVGRHATERARAALGGCDTP